jgi:hypothetical protein
MISQEIRNNDKIGIFYRLNYPYFNLNGAKFGDADNSLVCCNNFTSAEISSIGVFNIGLLYNYTLDSKAGILFKLGYENLNTEFEQTKSFIYQAIDPTNHNQYMDSINILNSMDINFSFINFSAQFSFMIMEGFRINAGLEGKYLLSAKQTYSEKLLDSNFKFNDGSTERNIFTDKDVKEFVNSLLYGINASAGYDIPLTNDKKCTFTPELSFYYNMNAPIKQIDWNFMNLGISLALKYEFQ